MSQTPETSYFSYDLKLSKQSDAPGLSFPVKLAYWAIGNPSHPAVLMPTCYGGTLASTLPFLYSEAAEKTSTPPVLPTSKYYIIICGLLGGSESSSPSNTPAPYNGKHFPQVTYEDNIRLQHALCINLGVNHLHAYIGFSMGGQQAYHFASIFPDFVSNAVCLAGSARTSWHNWNFLEGPKAALVTSVDFQDGDYMTKPLRGQRAFGRVYSTWALSQEWYRQRSWEQLGFKSLEEYLDKGWSMGDADAHDLLCLLHTWQKGDISVYHDVGDLPKALGRITARMMVMPSRTDAYFPPEDNEEEVKHLKKGELQVIPSIWGHLAGGGGGTTEDNEFIKQHIARFLGE
ncbi:MAG: hypothetical protein M1820_008450 [Bogoriella megaspora]|nr:MAG: hypothetical protein M1820_008450 [Bogoriella megaspora]